MKKYMWMFLLAGGVLFAQSEWKVSDMALTASDGDSGIYFGTSVDMGQNYAVVGAPNAPMGGAVYIYRRSNTGKWVPMQKINAVDAQISPSSQFDATDSVALSFFGASVAVAEPPVASMGVPLLVVGAPNTQVYHGRNNIGTGAVCTYELNTTTNQWQQQNKCILGYVQSVDGSVSSSFGKRVDIDMWLDLKGDHIKMVASDPEYDMKYANVGMVYFFAQGSNGWRLLQLAYGSGGAAGGNDVHFGQGLSIYHDTVAIGSPGDNIYDPNNSDPNTVSIIDKVGAAYFYTSNGAFVSSYTPPHTESAGGHNFGMSIDVFGAYAIVGEKHREGGYTNAAVYIMKRGTDGNWTQHNYIENNSTGYGYSVAINAKHAAVTALNGPAEGAVYAYLKDENGDWNTRAAYYWLDHSKQTAFGYDVALYLDEMMVGAPFADHVLQFSYETIMGANPSLIMYLLN